MSLLKVNLRNFCYILCIVIISFIYFIPNISVEATTINCKLTIVKYQLSEEELIGLELPIGSLLDKDNFDKELIGLSNITYEVIKVRPTNNSDKPFEAEPGFETILLRTDESGQVTTDLSEGVYQITELSDERLSNVAKPVIISLPFIQENGGELSHVYIYPKSGIINPNLPNNSNTIDTPSKIPQTDGRLISVEVIYYLFGIVAFLGILPFTMIKNKR